MALAIELQLDAQGAAAAEAAYRTRAHTPDHTLVTPRARLRLSIVLIDL